MSVAVSESTQLAVAGGPLSAVSTGIGAVVLALLTLILIEREVIRIRGPEDRRLRFLDMAAGPLLVAGAGVIGLRFLTILGTL